MNLREYQKKGVEDIRQAFMEGYRKVIYVLPCGGGKTPTFAAIAFGLQQRQKRAYIVVHREELLKQASRMLNRFGVPHGLLQGDKYGMPTAGVVVASIQTLTKRLDYMAKPDLIVCDESHRSISPSYKRVFDHWNDAYLLGVTATPKRLDGKPLGDIYEKMVEGPSVRWLMDNGFLSNYKAYAAKAKVDLSGVSTRMGDYAIDQITTIMRSREIIGDAVKGYRTYANGAPSIAFCCSVGHAMDVAQMFREAGYRSTHVDGGMKEAEREDAIQGLGNGKYQVITSCELISEGLDVPACTASILMRPTKSVALAIQQMGRCLRLHPDKPKAIILDHANILATHGLPDADRAWSLKDDPVKKKDASSLRGMTTCKHCFAKFSPALVECPRCGERREVAEAAVNYVDGEIHEITEEMKQEFLNTAAERARAEKEKAVLDAYAKKMGYKPGWVHHMMKAKQEKRVQSVDLNQLNMT